MISDVVDVYVGCNGGHRLGDNVFCELAKTCNAHSRVNHQVAIASTHMPNVAAKEWHDMRLEDESDVFVDPTKLKPSFGDLEHGVYGSAALEGASGQSVKAGHRPVRTRNKRCSLLARVCL
jgi:hypothetical protein